MSSILAKSLALMSICLVGFTQANDEQLFNIDSDRIRQIAFEAALERYPDIRADSLLEPPNSEHFVIWCKSALKLGYVSVASEDFDHCYATMRYEVEGTSNTKKYLDDDGFCYEETETKSFKVKVFSDGSAEVSPKGVGSGRARIECTEELERWSR